MLLHLYSFLIIFLVLLSNGAAAQNTEDIPYISNNEARRAITAALKSLPQAKCGKEPCAPATQEEFASPPVSVQQAHSALVAGAISARLRWCGLSWNDRAYTGLLLRSQAQGIFQSRILALIGLIHNLRFQKDYLELQALRTCSGKIRVNLEQNNPVIELDPWQQITRSVLMDDYVENMLMRVLEEIHKSRCGPVSCAPATEEEKAHPPLTIVQARQAMRIGLLSGAAEFCGLDWKKAIFYPFLAHNRHKLKMSTRQLSMISMLHGTMQGYIIEKYRKHEKVCSDTMRENLERELSPN